jgi:hypothetical protein
MRRKIIASFVTQMLHKFLLKMAQNSQNKIGPKKVIASFTLRRCFWVNRIAYNASTTSWNLLTVPDPVTVLGIYNASGLSPLGTQEPI